MMVKLLPAFLLLAGFYFNDARFIIDYYNVTNNAQANNLTFRMDSGNQRGSNFSYEIDLWNKLDVSTENVIVDVLAQSDQTTTDFDRVLSKITINLCSLGETLNTNLWIKYFFRPLLECATFEIKCPFPKGRYYIHCQLQEFCPDDCNFIPGWMVTGKFLVRIKFVAKFGKRKRMTEVIQIQIFGKYEQH